MKSLVEKWMESCGPAVKRPIQVLAPPRIRSGLQIGPRAHFLLSLLKAERCVLIVDPPELFMSYSHPKGRKRNLLSLAYLYLLGFFSRRFALLRLEHEPPPDNPRFRLNHFFEQRWTKHYRWDFDLSLPEPDVKKVLEASVALNIDFVDFINYRNQERMKHSHPKMGRFTGFLFLLSTFEEFEEMESESV